MHSGALARRQGVFFAAGFCLILGLAANAQELPKYEVTGFRDARFGMTEPEVRTAIKKSFLVKDADIKTGSNPTEGTTLLTVRVSSLDPGPGTATVTYIFGNKSKKLIQVNVGWGEDGRSEEHTSELQSLRHLVCRL